MSLVDGKAAAAEFTGDRGLAYGDGVFETIAWHDGRLVAWSNHIRRLRRGCEILGIAAPSGDLLYEECRGVAHGRARAVVKIIVTRGSGGRGYRPPDQAATRRVVSAHPWPSDLGLTNTRTWICAHPLSVNAATAGIKHLNRLDQVLASREWPGGDFFEGLMRDPSGLIVEGTRSNVFIVHADAVVTPDLSQCGVRGVVRDAVIAHCRRGGIELAEAPVTLDALLHADEIFICNSIIGVRAVTSVHGPGENPFRSGPMTARIEHSMRDEGVIV